MSEIIAELDLSVYQTPVPELATLVDISPNPAVTIDRSGTYLLMLERNSHPSISELAQPELKLAGVRINPATNGPSRGSYVKGIVIRNLKTDESYPVTGLPEMAQISGIKWSPDGASIAFTITEEKGIYLYIASIATGKSIRLSERKLNGCLGTAYYWLSDSSSLVALVIPENRPIAIEVNAIPKGPIIQESKGAKNTAPTFQDLLKNAEDERLFEYYFSSELVRIYLDSSFKKIGDAAVYGDVEPSPDGRFILKQIYHRPYSYLVPIRLFPLESTICTIDGEFLHEVYKRPLIEDVPWGADAVPTGKRALNWRADQPCTYYWVEAKDEGNPKSEAKIRDEVWEVNLLDEENGVRLLFESSLRFMGVNWGTCQTALFYERWWDSRKSVVTVVNPSDISDRKTLFDRSMEDIYSNPGSPEMTKNNWGRGVLKLIEGSKLYYLGIGATPEGNQPFVDKLDIYSGEKQRVWETEDRVYEVPFGIVGDDTLIYTREAPQEFPNYYLRSLKNTGEVSRLTHFKHPYPELKGIQKKVLRYKRKDGVDLTANLYLPPNYSAKQGPLPTLFWAYPKEFKNKDSAGQLASSPYQFNRVSYMGPIPFVTRGYAVLDEVAVPIVGEEGEEPNDTYIEQLIASAEAAIEEGVKLGVVDRDRVGASGHSYGAFMTANLLSHSELFKAGIARSGAYNRTLTPFGFQNEQRTFWEVPEIYHKMSPFNSAHKVKSPLLLIHGEADNNIGTFPLQSERYFSALKSNGVNTRLVVLPYESHGYVARESLLHMLWEMDQWLEQYVK